MLREKLELETSQDSDSPFRLTVCGAGTSRACSTAARKRTAESSCGELSQDILRTAGRKSGFVWQDRRVNIDHDYALDIIRKHKEYTEGKKLLMEKMIRFQTPFPAKLRVFYPDATRVYNTAEEATKDLAVFPVTVIQTPGTQLRGPFPVVL